MTKMADAQSKRLYQSLLPQAVNEKGFEGRARRCEWRISVDGVDTTEDIRLNLISMEITDNEEDEADDLQIKIADRDGVWLQKWLNDTIQKGVKTNGLKFEAWIGITDAYGNIVQQKTGTYHLDCVKHSGPPSVATLKCISLEFEGGIRTEKRDKAWERYKLSGIAKEIADKGKLKLQYLAENDPTFDRKQQDQETDLAFLKRLCKDEALSLKFTDGIMVIFDKKQFEKMQPHRNFKFKSDHCDYIKWDLGTSAGETQYDSCTVKYTYPKTGECIEGSYKSDEWYENEKDSDGKSKHQELVVTNKKVKSVGEAMHLAEKMLKMNNLFSKEASFTTMGDPSLMAGMTVYLEDFGFWNGLYMVASVKHTITTSGYTTKADLRKV